jgi:hypothetical protein
MVIKKQEFYEGAALHLLARTGGIKSVRYESPFFLLNDQLLVLLKYCTKGRSPWAFTFTGDEQAIMQKKATQSKIVIGLVCGADGVATVTYEAFLSVATPSESAIHIACNRQFNKHYEVKGPDGKVAGKIAPLNWFRILDF